MERTTVIEGTVRGPSGQPLEGLLVRASEVGLRYQAALGEASTDCQGRYRIAYAGARARCERRAAVSLTVLSALRGRVLYTLPDQRLLFDADSDERVDIDLAATPPAETPEFDDIAARIRASDPALPFDQLQETDQHRDLSWLARALNLPQQKLEHFALAHRVARLAGPDPAFAQLVYALLRQNTLLSNDPRSPFRIRLAVDSNTDPKGLLYDAVLADPDTVARDLTQAVETMLVDGAVLSRADAWRQALERYRKDAQAWEDGQRQRQLFDLVMRFVVDDRIGEAAALLQARRDDLPGAIARLTDPRFLTGGAQVDALLDAPAIDELVGNDHALIDAVAKDQGVTRPEQVGRLARLHERDWEAALTRLRVDDGDVSARAFALARQFERAYPTQAFAARLGRDPAPPIAHGEQIAALLESDDLDLRHTNIDSYFKQAGLLDDEHASLRAELKKIQRVFRLAPHYDKASRLMAQGIGAARDVAALGKARFLREFAPAADLGGAEARTLYAKAEAAAIAAMLIGGDLRDLALAGPIAAIDTRGLRPALDQAGAAFPNLTTLFQGTDNCACDACRSVAGPAAYLVELFEFIGKRSVTDLTVNPPVTNQAALEVLLARRPDLGDIDLSCDNADTPLPYIDLVNELLEQQVAPAPGIGYMGPLAGGADPLAGTIAAGLLSALNAAAIPVTAAAQVYPSEVASGSADALPHYIRDAQAVVKAVPTGPGAYQLLRLRQTLAPADELAAAPAYVNQAAYLLLANHAYAFGLPFDLQHAEASAYFARFGIERAALMQTFQLAGNPPPEAIAAETLGLSSAQRTLIATPDAADQPEYWGLSAADLKPVGTFLDKTGLSYAELDALLGFAFIDPLGQLFIRHLDLSCDLGQKEIAGLDDAALDRIHRLLRLQKATGWPLALVHEIVMQPGLGAGTLDDAALGVAATLQRINRQTGIALAELVGCYGSFPPDLYAAVFLDKASNGVADPALLPDAVDGSGFLADVAASVAVALRLGRQDLDLLLTLLVDNRLSVANLSRLFLLTRLMRALTLSAPDLDALIDLSALDPTASPAATLDFAAQALAARRQPQGPQDLRFLLYHRAGTPQDLARRELKDGTLAAMLGALQAAYQAAYAQASSPFNPYLAPTEQQPALFGLLGQFGAVTAADMQAIAGFLTRAWTSSAAAHALIDALFTPILDSGAIHTAIDQLAAVPSGADITAQSGALLRAIMDTLAAYLFAQAKADLLLASLGAAFKVDAGLARAVLAQAVLRQPAPGTAVVREVLLSDALIDTVHAVPTPPAITEAAFPQHYQALRLLHKLLPLAAAYGVDPDTVAWVLAQAPALGWFEWDAIPYQGGQTEASWPAFTDLGALLALAATLTPVQDPADAATPVTLWSVLALTLPGSGATRAQFLARLTLLTGYDPDSLDAIDAYFFPAFDLADYRLAASWTRLLGAADTLRRLASPLADVLGFLKPVLTAADTARLRMALKSRYDDPGWLQTLRDIMDSLRPAKRDALVAYLLATHPEFHDTDDLYDHWLLDVEMDACMPSSRIVQAHNTMQLFVQRCLMGLEPAASADSAIDSGWAQWTWVSQYRVWQANMLVWCYPENWIEPELRDDKSFIFQDLENELKQSEPTSDSAGHALTHYLEQLDGLSFLEVVATWYDVQLRVMHVFARTKGGDPATYYHRQFAQERSWTAWDKVDLEITGAQLMAFSHNARLHLAWPIFSEEPDPAPQATVPNGTAGTVVNADQARRKLKVQLAVSELAEGVWQPKRISTDAVRTPAVYTSDDLGQDAFNLIYIESATMILLLKTTGQDSVELRGVFDIAGCKGYPELLAEGDWAFPDFFPDFKDTLLTVQRYREANLIPGEQLAARTALFPFNFYDILVETPGTFRVTYPHQMTPLDWVALLIEYLLLAADGAPAAAGYDRRRTIKLPMGTLLPYFMEDSIHAYVITPGFYARPKGEDPNPAALQRTASDMLALIDLVVALYRKTMARLKAGEPPAQVLAELVADDDYHAVVAELKLIASLRYGERFSNMYHPLICALRRTLYQQGVPALMARATQLQDSGFDFDSYYAPTAIVPPVHPVEDVDFDSAGSYSSYNWELFYHVPMLVAGQLTANQRFQEAMDWLHYIFNPTGALPGDVPQKYWVTKPFFLRNASDYLAQRIDTLLYRTADPDDPALADLALAVQAWRDNPFQPHAVAGFRTVAYQKTTLMSYIDNLIAWGDNLFRQDTMESIAQATQMYILADQLLGPKPRTVPPVLTPPNQTWYQIRGRIGLQDDALIELENILPDLGALPEGGAELPPLPSTLAMPYFCVPQNDKLLAYWDTVADRLFKIRHCQDIDGVERSLALFAPPIDPGLLVRAAASGLDLASVIAGLSAPLPYYRFQTLVQKALDLAQEVRNLGNALLQVLEKKDAEDLALLRSALEIRLQNALVDVKQLAIQEAQAQLEVLQQNRAVTEARYQFYATIQKVNDKEQLNLDKLADAHDWERNAQLGRTLAGIVAMVPDLVNGASGFGGSPHVTLAWGGKNLAAAAHAAADVCQVLSLNAANEANLAGINGQHDRRFDDWQLQASLAQKELASIDKQIEAAGLRLEIAQRDLSNQQIGIQNSQQIDDFMRRKFTNRDLYQWMAGQAGDVYFAAYKLAHAQAVRAERAWQYELGRDDSFIAYGYWDSRKQGLQSADRLIGDLKRMEAAYLDQNRREYELTRHVSLALLDPLALLRLRTTGSCDFSVPEALFDLDYPGQHFRRLKSVGSSVPCTIGSQTPLSAKLTLTGNRYRKALSPDNNAGTGYAEDPGKDERFVYNLGSIQSIATSSGQKDSGTFELNFHDERYLPFEGTGAIGDWRLELPRPELAQFDYGTIADVVLHLNYTARDGGAGLRALAEAGLLDRLGQIRQDLAQTGLHTLIRVRYELPNEWYQLTQNGSTLLTIDATRLPYLAQALDATIDDVVLLAEVAGNPASFAIALDGSTTTLARIDDWHLCKADTTAISLGNPVALSVQPADRSKLQDLLLVVKYGFS